MTLAESVRRFFEECPLLEGGRINVNYLGSRGGEFSIECVPAEPVVKRYVDGGCVRQYVFLFASREYYDCDELESMNTALFYEELSRWIEEKNKRGELPEIDGGRAESLEAETMGYLYSVRGNTARFQIQCRLKYRK